MATKKTSNTFTLKRLSKDTETSGLIRSKSLCIVAAILRGEKIHKSIWDYLFDPQSHRQDVLIDVLKRLPHKRVRIKKKIINVLIERDYFTETRLRDWAEHFVGSEQLSKHLLDKFFAKKKTLANVEQK
jgi:hypothetical protein